MASWARRRCASSRAISSASAGDWRRARLRSSSKSSLRAAAASFCACCCCRAAARCASCADQEDRVRSPTTTTMIHEAHATATHLFGVFGGFLLLYFARFLLLGLLNRPVYKPHTHTHGVKWFPVVFCCGPLRSAYIPVLLGAGDTLLNRKFGTSTQQRTRTTSLLIQKNPLIGKLLLRGRVLGWNSPACAPRVAQTP